MSAKQRTENINYWRRRSLAIEAYKDKTARTGIAELEDIFKAAQKELEREISVFYHRFAVNNDIDLTEAKKLLNSRELEEFRWDIDQYLKYAQENTLNRQWTKELENASIRYRVSRLEALKVQTQHTLEKLFGNQLDHIDELLKTQYLDNYYRTLFEVQKGFNIGWDVAAIDERQLRQILSKPWTGDNRTFSDRIWNRKQDVINETHKMLTQNILMGNHPSVGINKLKEKLGTTKHAATRLIMTESAYFANAAQLDVYKELNVEMFEILATLDCRTCDICGELDGRVIKTAHFQSGVTVPPFHPFCRCTTVPHIPDDFGERIARDKDGKTYYVPTDMKYTEWKDSYVHKHYKPRTEHLNILHERAIMENEIFDLHVQALKDNEMFDLHVQALKDNELFDLHVQALRDNELWDLANRLKDNNMLNAKQYRNNIQKILDTATPNAGSIIFEVGAKLSPKELNAVNWLHNTLGGDIKVLKRINQHKVQTPDLLWRGAYLEIKHVSGKLNTLDQQIRKGFKQTKNGGVLVDISSSAFTDEEVINMALKRIGQSSGGYVIIIRDDILIGYIYGE